MLQFVPPCYFDGYDNDSSIDRDMFDGIDDSDDSNRDYDD